MLRLIRSLSCVIALALLAPDVPGQASAEREALAPEMERLEQRQREELHPGQPLKLRGMDVDMLRTLTPALVGPTRDAAAVDDDEAYERRLAMYDGRTRFTSAPRSSGTARRAPRPMLEAPEPEPDAKPDTGDERERNEEWPRWPWLIAAAAAGGYVYARTQKPSA